MDYMDVFESKLGSIFVIIYALASILFASLSFFCSTIACGLLLVVPILPWAVIMEGSIGVNIPWAAYPVFLLLNVIIIYSMGVAIDYVYQQYQR